MKKFQVSLLACSEVNPYFGSSPYHLQNRWDSHYSEPKGDEADDGIGNIEPSWNLHIPILDARLPSV